MKLEGIHVEGAGVGGGVRLKSVYYMAVLRDSAVQL